MPARKQADAGHLPHRNLGAAALACMGVVFGDIGTSPLYTLQVATKSASVAGAIAPEAVLGIVSLIFWSLIVVISIKYAVLIMRADNHGEGGILALLALVTPRRAKQSRRRAIIVIIGLIGATLLYGDGCITPAISVLSAIEGLKVYAPQTAHFIIPLTVIILIGLFLIQRMGTSWIGRIFGPIMLVWFLAIGILGIRGIVREPGILAAFNPLAAITYLWHAGPLALAVIGGAFLAVTGGEAFYADMGHFGPVPIRIAWFGVALPALTLNYFGQGALLLNEPNAIENPFYILAPTWSHYPLIVLATMATVIASQSIISGAFSLTQQAIQLGFLPRMNIVHTAGHEIGQIYMPVVNWALACGTLVAVIGFGSSDALAGAFGIAVSLLMAITTLMATFVALHWKHNPLIVYTVNGSFLLIDLLFLASTSTKLQDGGWFPLLISLLICFLMLTWRRGEEIIDTGARRNPPELVSVHGGSAEESALPPSRHRGRSRAHDARHPAGADGEPEVQSRPSRENAARCGRGRGRTVRVCRRPGEGHACVRLLVSGRTAIRFYGKTKCPRGLRGGHRARAHTPVRSEVADLLYRTRADHSERPARRNGALARGNLRAYAPQCAKARRIFQHPECSGARDRSGIRDLETACLSRIKCGGMVWLEILLRLQPFSKAAIRMLD